MINNSRKKLVSVERDELLAYLDTTINKDWESGVLTGLVVIEINQFRRVSVTYGYDRVEELLQQLQARLESQLPKKDRVFYHGRDEFVIVLSSLRVSEQLQLAINKIQRIVFEPFILRDTSLRVRLTIGASLSTRVLVRSATLMQQASHALLDAYDSHAEKLIYVKPESDIELPSLELQAYLSDALDRNELTAVFQPKTELKTGRVVGVESLARWNSHMLGRISPDEFIEAAETSGLIGKLTIWSINNAAKQYAQWGDLAVPIAVNLSAKVINQPGLVRQIQSALRIWNVPPEALVLEITETAVMDSPEQSMRCLKEISEMGIKLAIDDFGTGYSSLAYLKMLPVSELKVDKSFVQQLATDPDDRKIVESIINMAHNFDLKVIAEGIEDETSYEILMGMGCEIAQGYLVSKPLKPEQFEQWLREDNWYRPVSTQLEAAVA